MTPPAPGTAGHLQSGPPQPAVPSVPVHPDGTANHTGSALLLVMLDIDPAVDEDEFNRWYFEEHIAERLACPGFISARRFIAVHGQPRYLALYEIDSPDALTTSEYQNLARSSATGNSVEHPTGTPRTFTMLQAFRNPTRNIYLEIQPPVAGGSPTGGP